MNQVRLSAQQWPGESQRDRLAHAPAGWVYNPSSWAQRVPLVILAFVGFVIAGWLALYQLGVVPEIPEPFFGDGSQRILNSGISHALPVPDAALGAFGYLIDAVFGLMGGNERWKQLPWVVIIFAIAVIPFGATSILLFILQPTIFGSWCTLCLISVAISLAMVPYAWDEFVASWHWVRGRMDAGITLWSALIGR
ncbi:MAG: vitamin K epoxide reductase family protein [Blastocatellia bacterium]